MYAALGKDRKVLKQTLPGVTRTWILPVQDNLPPAILLMRSLRLRNRDQSHFVLPVVVGESRDDDVQAGWDGRNNLGRHWKWKIDSNETLRLIESAWKPLPGGSGLVYSGKERFNGPLERCSFKIQWCGLPSSGCQSVYKQIGLRKKRRQFRLPLLRCPARNRFRHFCLAGRNTRRSRLQSGKVLKHYKRLFRMRMR